PRAILSVPRASAQSIRPADRGNGPATPKSATTTRAPACRASTLMAAPPARKFSTICAVTIWGYALTPSATTPWSAANTKTIARGSQSLVHEAEEIAEAKPLRRLGMDPLADFVADEDDIPRAAADERRQRRALAQNHLVGVAAQQAIGHPERHAVDEYRVGPAIQLVERTNQVERFLDRLPVRWPVRAVARDALGHGAVAGP